MLSDTQKFVVSHCGLLRKLSVEGGRVGKEEQKTIPLPITAVCIGQRAETVAGEV